MKEKKKIAKSSKGCESLFGSIKGKVIFMGAISIIASIILGVAGLQSLSKNSVNNEVLAKINNINLLQYENQSLDTSYLYFLDDSYLEQIINNLVEMEENARIAVELTSGSQKTEMESVLANITACKANYEQIRTLCQERGFSSEAGAYAEFLVNDTALGQDFTTVANDMSWVDGKWMNTYDDGNMIEADGTVYSKTSYTGDMPQVGKRDYFVLRVGGSGVFYDGTIYVTNLKFQGAGGDLEIDFSSLDPSMIERSNGNALSSVEFGEFNGTPAIKMESSFNGVDGAWREIFIYLSSKEYDLQNYTSVSYDTYFENTYVEGLQVGFSLSDKYAFADNLGYVNTEVLNYSKSVVEGKDVTAQITAITEKLDEIITNVDAYVVDEALKSSILDKMESKKSVFINMSENDTSILDLKKANIEISTALTEETSSVRAGIEADTNATKTSLTLLITVILIASATILVLITLAVSRSMNRSVRKFKEALHQVMDGNLNVRADDKGKDEFAVFGRTLNAFLEKLTEIIQSAQKVSENVSGSGDELREMSASSSETSAEIERAVEDISKGAASQAEDIEEASGSIAEMGDIFGKIVTNVESLNSVTGEMRSIAQESTAFMKELAASNEKTAKAFEQVAQQIHITNESVNKIHEAAGFITSIASQTNLLSLNASIEAARAGEAGRGFAVVATEIQQLSEQSNASAKNIENIIKELSVEANRTVEIVDEVTDVVSEQQDKLVNTQKKFADLEKRVQMAGQETDEIKGFTSDCDKARQKVEEVIENLSAISEENAASTEETTASMAQLNDTIMKLAEEAKALNQFAEKLEGDLKFFHM